MRRFVLAVLVGLALNASAQQYVPPEPDMAPVEWPGDQRAAFDLAFAIVDAATVDLEQCDIAIRAGTLGRVQNKDACVRALHYGYGGSRSHQAQGKLLELTKDPEVQKQLSVADMQRALNVTRKAMRHFAFVKERLVR